MLLSLLIASIGFSEEKAPELVIGKILPKRPQVGADKGDVKVEPNKEKRPLVGDVDKKRPPVDNLGKDVPVFNSKPFPRHWGKPPVLQTRDIRPLPGGFGMGSSTLAGWISENIKNDLNKPKPKPRPPLPKRPEPSEEVKERLVAVKLAQNELNLARKALLSDLKGKSKEDIAVLVTNFRDSQKEKHQELKEARKALAQEVRSRIQTGARRESE